MNKNDLHVIFGTGPVGMAIMEELTKRGYTNIRMVNRSGRGSIAATIDVVAGNAMDKNFTRKTAEGASVVYFALNPTYDKWLELFPPMQEGVLVAAESAGAKLIAVENVYMYGHTQGKPMTEATPHNPHTRKGKLRMEMTQQLMDAHEKGRVRVATGRASDFFGEGVLESAMGERVLYPAVAGKSASIIGSADYPHTYTYMADVGKGLVTLAEHDEALGQAWHIPSAETLTTRQFIEKVYKFAGHPTKISPAPKFILTIMGLFNPIIREVNEMVYEFEEPFIVDHSKFVKAFGDVSTPLDDAIRATVAWFKAHPKHK